MIMTFSHHVDCATLGSVVFHVGLMFCLVVFAQMLHGGGNLNQTIALAGTHRISLAACLLVVINSSSGLHEKFLENHLWVSLRHSPRADGGIVRAPQILGVSPPTLYR